LRTDWVDPAALEATFGWLTVAARLVAAALVVNSTLRLGAAVDGLSATATLAPPSNPRVTVAATTLVLIFIGWFFLLCRAPPQDAFRYHRVIRTV
jgi:hypothetical protein